MPNPHYAGDDFKVRELKLIGVRGTLMFIVLFVGEHHIVSYKQDENQDLEVVSVFKNNRLVTRLVSDMAVGSNMMIAVFRSERKTVVHFEMVRDFFKCF